MLAGSFQLEAFAGRTAAFLAEASAGRTAALLAEDKLDFEGRWASRIVVVAGIQAPVAEG